VFALDYDKEGHHLISGSNDGLINIYSMEQGTAQYGNLLGSYNSSEVEVWSVVVANIARKM
jgi:hypothetical protein